LTASITDLSALGESLRRHDHDRYATAMFADPARRGDLWTLYAFNLELSQIRTQVREPLAGMIRLQWWRDVVEGARREEAMRHPVGGPLLDLIERRQLQLTALCGMIDARQHDLDPAPFATTTDWQEYGRRTSGALAGLAAAVLGAEDCAAAESAGTAWALTGLLRSVPFHLAQGWSTLPADTVSTTDDKRALAVSILTLIDLVSQHLRQCRRLPAPRAALPALLPAVLAGAYLRRIRSLGGDVFDSRSYRPRPMPVRLAWAALRGRV
jgi:phytoene/squalene synthetase